MSDDLLKRAVDAFWDCPENANASIGDSDIDIEAGVRAVLALNDWQPIETARKDGTQIIGWDGSHYGLIWWEADPTRTPLGEPCWCEEADAPSLFHPTHWMPLRKPQKGRS